MLVDMSWNGNDRVVCTWSKDLLRLESSDTHPGRLEQLRKLRSPGEQARNSLAMATVLAEASEICDFQFTQRELLVVRRRGTHTDVMCKVIEDAFLAIGIKVTIREV